MFNCERKLLHKNPLHTLPHNDDGYCRDIKQWCTLNLHHYIQLEDKAKQKFTIKEKRAQLLVFDTEFCTL